MEEASTSMDGPIPHTATLYSPPLTAQPAFLFMKACFPFDDIFQISYNWCDADDAVFAVYYLDNGSSRWDVFQNVASNSALPWCYFMTGGGGPSGKASNSSVSELWCQDTSPGRNDCADLGCTVDDSTVLYCARLSLPSISSSPCFQLPESV